MEEESNFSKHINRVRSQGALLIACVMLSVDSLNPIKIVCSTIGIPTNFVAYLSLILLLYLFGSHFTELAYFGVRVFFTSILSIFFAKNDCIGKSNIPRHGPIIFTGNHANQFVDALQVMTNCGHKVGFLIALKSFQRPVVGFFARIMGCIPVARPQDTAIKMPDSETIRVNGNIIYGNNTSFTSQLKIKDKIRLRGNPEQLVVKKIVSDTELVIEQVCGDELKEMNDSKWDLLHYVNQSNVYDGVYEALRMGQCFGIFPEGGSHDRPDLLPLKVGVAVIAFGLIEKHNIAVPIVPIGLNYYNGHRFRGRAVVEFGPPIRISPELYELYKKDKREAYKELMLIIENSMRSCIVTAPDYSVLELVSMARRLYIPSHKIPTPELKQDMNRRFAEGYKMLLRQYSLEANDRINSDDEHLGFSNKDLPEDARILKEHLEDYIRKLNELGLKDYQVPTLAYPNPLRATYIVLHLFVAWSLAAFPSLILNAPVGIVARKMAESERKRALAGSVVKITGKDVMMTKKIIISIVMVPSLWILYAFIICFFTNWGNSLKVWIILSMPLFSYAGIMATEAGMVDIKDLKPILMRLRPEKKREMLKLPYIRSQLQAELREFVAKIGPSLGDIYNKLEPLNWNELIKNRPYSVSASNFEYMAKSAAALMDGKSLSVKTD